MQQSVTNSWLTMYQLCLPHMTKTENCDENKLNIKKQLVHGQKVREVNLEWYHNSLRLKDLRN